MLNPVLPNDDLLEMQEEDSQQGKYLTFALGREEYGLEIRHVAEIIGIQNITGLPDMPGYVKGVINLRGKVIPVIDLRLRFSLEARAYDERTCIVVVNVGHAPVGLIVDSVCEVLGIEEGKIEPPPGVRKGPGSRYIKGLGQVGEAVKILLDISSLLYDEDLAPPTEAASV